MIHKRALPAEIAGEHPADLGHRHVRLVHDQQAVRREKVEQRVRRFPRLAARPDAASNSRSPSNSPPPSTSPCRTAFAPPAAAPPAAFLVPSSPGAAVPALYRYSRRPPESALRAARNAWPGKHTCHCVFPARSPSAGRSSPAAQPRLRIARSDSRTPRRPARARPRRRAPGTSPAQTTRRSARTGYRRT